MVLQHFLGKEKVPGSNPGVGSTNPISERLAGACHEYFARPQAGEVRDGRRESGSCRVIECDGEAW